MTQEGSPAGGPRPVRPAAAPITPPPNEGHVNRFMLEIRAELEVVPAGQTTTTEDTR